MTGGPLRCRTSSIARLAWRSTHGETKIRPVPRAASSDTTASTSPRGGADGGLDAGQRKAGDLLGAADDDEPHRRYPRIMIATISP